MRATLQDETNNRFKSKSNNTTHAKYKNKAGKCNACGTYRAFYLLFPFTLKISKHVRA